MVKAQSPALLAATFIENNRAAVDASGKTAEEVQDYVAIALQLKRRVYLSNLGQSVRIMEPAGRDDNFARSPSACSWLWL